MESARSEPVKGQLRAPDDNRGDVIARGTRVRADAAVLDEAWTPGPSTMRYSKKTLRKIKSGKCSARVDSSRRALR
jgi:hypothetical protein